MERFDFCLPTRVVFGRGRVAGLRGLLPIEGVTRVLVVTDEGVLRGSGAIARVLKALAEVEAVEVFTEVEANPSFETVDRAAAMAREMRAQVVVGCGGGSPMDVAKGAAVLAGEAGVLMRELMEVGSDVLGGGGGVLPIVCLPTTAGTGSEVTPFAVFTDREHGNKGGYTDGRIYPRVAVVDADLMDSMPRRVVVDTGLDALTHGIEAYLSRDANVWSDRFALSAVQMVRDYLGPAADGDRVGMERMGYGAVSAGVAIAQAGTVLLHLMGYPLTVFGGVTHGRANAALLPAFMQFMGEAGDEVARARVLELAGMFGAVGGLRGFVEGLGVSTNVADYGVGIDDLDLYVSKCVGKGDLKITPVEGVLDDWVIRGIYGRAGVG